MPRLVCAGCGRTISTTLFKARMRYGLESLCLSCGTDIVTGEKRPSRATDSQRRSRAQEKRVAAREGGRRQPGSGSVEGFEGDVRVTGRYRGECKFTRAKSFSLKLEELLRLERQAGRELPAFDIEFQGVNPHRRYVVLPEWAFSALMEESGRRKHADTDD